jgi:hypothetical protein
MSEPHEPGAEPAQADVDAAPQTLEPDDALAAERAKGAELDQRLDRLEDEALPKPAHPAPIGGMIGT